MQDKTRRAESRPVPAIVLYGMTWYIKRQTRDIVSDIAAVIAGCINTARR